MQKVTAYGEMGAGDGGIRTRRLERAAHEFEGQILKELLKPMTEPDGLTGDDGEKSLRSTCSVLGEFASDALGQALSQKGGFGIADAIVARLTHCVVPDPSGKYGTDCLSSPHKNG